jgi:excisionase family DNA binding protein
MLTRSSDVKRVEPPVKLLVTVQEACEALGIKRTVLYTLMNGKHGCVRLMSVKVGGRRLIPMVALQAFVARLCEEGE